MNWSLPRSVKLIYGIYKTYYDQYQTIFCSVNLEILSREKLIGHFKTSRQ